MTMKQIRKSIFETNSSSSHSLVMSKINRGYDFDLPVDEDGVLTIRFGEYGWGPDILRTHIDKLEYWFTDNVPGHLRWHTAEENIQEWFDKEVQILMHDKWKEQIGIIMKKCPQVKSISFKMNDSYYPFGYVDHESVGTSRCTEFENLVFNNGVAVIVDNDNSNEFELYFENWKGEPPRCDVENLFDNTKTLGELLDDTGKEEHI